MGNGCLLYYITDRRAFNGNEEAQRRRLFNKIGEACNEGVDYIQLREKDLSAREMEELAREAVRVIWEQSSFAPEGRPSTVLLINSRTDVALAANAGGVHLTAGDVSVGDVRKVWSVAGNAVEERKIATERMRISISCHSILEVVRAADAGADLALLAPIFEKKDAPGERSLAIGAVREAAAVKIPVVALGGVTLQNAQSCLRAGAAGIAAIRLFQENDIAFVVRALQAI
jgi:thiamine-phosphate pyrophosphorylase